MATPPSGTSPPTAPGDGAGAHTPPHIPDLVVTALGSQTPTVLGAIAFIKENIQKTFPLSSSAKMAKLSHQDARTLFAVSVWLEENVVSSAHNPAFSTVEHRLDTLAKAVDRNSTEIAKVRAFVALRTTVEDEDEDARVVDEELGATVCHRGGQETPPWTTVSHRRSATPKLPLEQRLPRTETLLKRSGTEDRAFKALSPADMVAKLRESIKASFPSGGAGSAIAAADVNKLVRAVRPLPSGDLIICSSTPELAVLLKEHASRWLPKATAAYNVHLPSWGVVIHRVPTTFDPRSPSSVTAFRTENEHLIPADAPISWLSRQPTAASGTTKKHGSVVIHLPSIAQANLILQEGIGYGGRLLRAERVMRSPPQCWRCQRFGHVSLQCKQPARCALCADPHPTKDCACPADPSCEDLRACAHVAHKCANCGLAHKSTSVQCAERKRAFDAAKVRALRQGDLYLSSSSPSE